jgi:hypothetical protein
MKMKIDRVFHNEIIRFDVDGDPKESQDTVLRGNVDLESLSSFLNSLMVRRFKLEKVP